MKRLIWLAGPVLLSACAAQLQATVPQPVVSVSATASTPAAADATVAADAPAADADAEPIAQGDPEEVTATTEPPDPVYEEQTDSPGPGYAWVGGYWGWNGVDWGWNWGRWAVAPEGTVYVDPYYERVGDNVVYVRGYWGPHDYVARSYGGDRIRFAAAVRPDNYHRGDHLVVEHRAGPLPGQRPGGLYEKATGALRSVPHQTVPQHVAVAAHVNATVSARGGVAPEAHKTTPTAAAPARANTSVTAGAHAGTPAAHPGGTAQPAAHATPQQTAQKKKPDPNPTPANKPAPKGGSAKKK